MLQPVDINHYKISVVSKSGVPDFGPSFPREGIVQIDGDFKKKLFKKLVNADQASCKTGKLAQMNLRYRESMLKQMDQQLKQNMTSFSESANKENGWVPWFCQVL